MGQEGMYYINDEWWAVIDTEVFNHNTTLTVQRKRVSRPGPEWEPALVEGKFLINEILTKIQTCARDGRLYR